MTLKQFCDSICAVDGAEHFNIMTFTTRIGGVEFKMDNICFNGTMSNERGMYGLNLDLTNLEETFKDEDDEDFC